MVKYLFVDTETTGLNTHKDASIRHNPCLQIAGILTDENLEILDEFNFFVKTPDKDFDDMSEFVRNMHTHTGLLNNIKHYGLEKYDVESYIICHLTDYVGKDEKIIPAGNNINFDKEVIRQNFPYLYQKLHHGSLDVSSIRRAFGLINPEFPHSVKIAKESNHDARIDIYECLKELRFYLKHIDIPTEVKL